jgi:hypothetical protein
MNGVLRVGMDIAKGRYFLIRGTMKNVSSISSKIANFMPQWSWQACPNSALKSEFSMFSPEC